MKDRKRSDLVKVTLMVVVATACTLVAAQKNEPIYDSDIKVKSFEEMPYPPIAREARIQGTVVVSAKLDDAGNVTSTTAISGAKLLIPDSLSNAKKWRFNPNTNGLAIIIYEFRISEGKCNHESKRFLFREPNRVLIVSCGVYTWQP
jgi:TonB family protein